MFLKTVLRTTLRLTSVDETPGRPGDRNLHVYSTPGPGPPSETGGPRVSGTTPRVVDPGPDFVAVWRKGWGGVTGPPVDQRVG